MKIDMEKELYIGVIIGLCIVILVQYLIFKYSFETIFFANVIGVSLVYLIFRYLIDKRILKDEG